jgi:hypothetical protein
VSYPFQFAYDTGNRLLWKSFPDGDSLGASGNPIRYDDGGRVTTLPGVVAGATWTAWVARSLEQPQHDGDRPHRSTTAGSGS